MTYYTQALLEKTSRVNEYNEDLKLSFNVFQLGHHATYNLLAKHLLQYHDSGKEEDLELVFDLIDEADFATLNSLYPTKDR